MRAISISTEVFAEVWKKHQAGDSTEDDILRRVLKLPKRHLETEEISEATPTGRAGYEDVRYGVRVPENFEIFRTYKGKQFRAKATGGKWLLLNDRKLYPSLHKLSWAVVSGHENTWYNWKYKSADGSEPFIHTLRDSSKVASRV